MKAEEIDKRIGMPDVDAEWEKFSEEVVKDGSEYLLSNPKKKKKMKKIAALLFLVLSFSGVVLATAYHLSALDEKETEIDKSGETKPLVVYRENGFKDKKSRYLVNLCKGTYIQNYEGKGYIEEEHLLYAFCERGYKLTMMLDGKPFDKNSLPDLTNKDLKKIEQTLANGIMTVNLITKDVKVPAAVNGNLPREMTVLLPGNGNINITMNKATEGDWMNCNSTSWEPTSWGWNVAKEFERVKDVKGFTAYVYSSTETKQDDIDRAAAMLNDVGIKNVVYKKNIHIRHFTDAELRKWAQKEKADGTAYGKLLGKMALQGMPVSDVYTQWHVVKEVYGRK